MEPAHDIPWRPLGQLLVDRGLITEAELEEALDEQTLTGMRLGEVLVKRGLVSGPDLTQMLMEQLGIELKKEEGFGSGLWAAIKQRHPRGGEEEEAADDAEPESSSDEPPSLVLVDRLYERLETEVGLEEAAESHGVESDELANLRARAVVLEAELEAERSARAAAEVELELAQAEITEDADAASWPAEAVAEAEARLAEEQTARQHAEHGAHEAERRAQELEQKVEETERRAKQAEQRAEQAEHAAQTAHEAARGAEESAQRIAELEQALELANARAAELEPDLEAAQAHAAGLAERMDAERTAGSEALTGLEQALTELASRHELLQQQRDEEREVLEEFERVRIELHHRGERITELESELEVLRRKENDRRASEAAMAAHDAELAVLVERIDATDGLFLREREVHAETRRLLAEALEQLASGAGAVAAAGHLLFVPNPDGYELIELDGPAPAVGDDVEHAAIRLVVSKLGRSPLPLDRRPCAYLVPV